MFYTVVKCKFNKHGEIVKEINFNLEPMTLKEAQTFKVDKLNKLLNYKENINRKIYIIN